MSTMTRDICLRCLASSHSGGDGTRTHDFYVANVAQSPTLTCTNARRRRSRSHLTYPSQPLATVHYRPYWHDSGTADSVLGDRWSGLP
jgi:hypothetical protein